MKRIRKQILVIAALVGLCEPHVAMGDKSRDNDFAQKQTSLQQFEGFYRFPNRVAYIQFDVVNNQLRARQVWDGRQYELKKTGELTFESVEEHYKLAFDAAPPTEVKILDRVDLTKVDFDPEQRKSVPPLLAKLYAGSYHREGNEKFEIKVISDGGNLVLIQGWDSKRIQLACITDQEFINQEAAMPVTFFTESNQKIVMHCFESDRWIKME